MNITPPPFSWKNYFRPTPGNLEKWVEAIHGGLIVVVGTSWAQGASTKTLLIMTLAGYALDKLSRFFGRVAKDMEEKEQNVTPEADTTKN